MQTKRCVIYGINNCDSVKKARHWLEQQSISYHFHDYRSSVIDESWLQLVIEHVGLEQLLNKRGTTWRKLDESVRNSAHNMESAKHLLLMHPTLIKRPLLQVNQHYFVGFTPEKYQTIFFGVNT